MRFMADTTSNSLTIIDGPNSLNGPGKQIDLYGQEAFEILSDLWLKTSWNQKYPYTFTWLGRPIIQHPEDLIRFQEVLYSVKPDVLVETGVAHGGSLIFYAALFKAMGKGRVIGVDIEIRPHNRAAIEAHDLSSYITLIEGDSVAPETLEQVRSHIAPQERVMVVLDSDHSYAHVSRELAAYHPLVTTGSYIVATDGIMQNLEDVPRGQPGWGQDNPARAAREFVGNSPDFILDQPPWLFNESDLSKPITGWPDAWLKRIKK